MKLRNATSIGPVGRLAVRLRLAAFVRRFRTDEKGVTAVEFGLIAFPFFAVMAAIIETALAFFAQQLLDEAVQTTARLVRTGQAQAQALTAANFKTQLCTQLVLMFNCEASMVVDIQTATSFGTLDLSVPRTEDGNLRSTDTSYTLGASSSIVVVRAFYEWPVYVDRLGNDLATEPNGTRLMTSTAVFRNEPFPW